jgi:tRNA threonylcarbamoyladenosine biosynthesis protein TsaB
MPDFLAFDTSTETLSIAVSRGDSVWWHDAPGGAQASTTLIPQIQRLLAEAGLALNRLDAIAFGRGPGSFTGLRTACAVAQGLGFGAGVPLLPVDSLHAVAQDAHERLGVQRIVALLDARMDQVYVAHYAFDGSDDDRTPRLLAPEGVVAPPGFVLAGNAFSAYGARLPADVARHDALSTARALLKLAPRLLESGFAVAPQDATPLYIRDKVAQTTAERALAKPS